MCRRILESLQCQVVLGSAAFFDIPRYCLSGLSSAATRVARDEDGATAIEYGLILAGISIAILATVFAIGTELDNVFDMIGSRMQNRFSTL